MGKIWGPNGQKTRVCVTLLLTFSAICTSFLGVAAGHNRQMSVFWGLSAKREAVEEPQAPQGVLSGYVIAVDAGHGGYDGGAVGRTSGVAEKEINLGVAVKTKALLEELGSTVIMTRTGDYALCDEDPPIRKKLQDMQRRAEIILQGDVDLVLSIHMNEYKASSVKGPQVFYRENCESGKLLAHTMQDAMNDVLKPSRARAAMGGDYYILTLGIPSVLIECGFLSNPKEEALLQTDDYQQQVARSILSGVESWVAMSEDHPEPLPVREEL